MIDQIASRANGSLVKATAKPVEKKSFFNFKSNSKSNINDPKLDNRVAYLVSITHSRQTPACYIHLHSIGTSKCSFTFFKKK